MAAKAVALVRQATSFTQRLSSRPSLIAGHFKVSAFIVGTLVSGGESLIPFPTYFLSKLNLICIVGAPLHRNSEFYAKQVRCGIFIVGSLSI